MTLTHTSMSTRTNTVVKRPPPRLPTSTLTMVRKPVADPADLFKMSVLDHFAKLLAEFDDVEREPIVGSGDWSKGTIYLRSLDDRQWLRYI